MAAIETEGLEREFGSRGRAIKAVDGIDIQVQPGEVYGFLGPNGAGKTTTVRMLVTLLRPTGGHARVAGFDVAHQPGEVRKRIGVALQEAALDLLMTGRELMELQATLHGIAPRDVRGRATELIQRVGLEQAQDRRVGTYSGGMRRRLDLAMALIHEPEVLFLDEPTTGLDPVSRVTLWDEFVTSGVQALSGGNMAMELIEGHPRILPCERPQWPDAEAALLPRHHGGKGRRVPARPGRRRPGR